MHRKPKGLNNASLTLNAWMIVLMKDAVDKMLENSKIRR